MWTSAKSSDGPTEAATSTDTKANNKSCSSCPNKAVALRSKVWVQGAN